MDNNKLLSDNAILADLGSRIARYRLNRNLTQAQLATEAGVSLSTVNRIESGSSAQFSNLIRVLRTLDLLDNLDLLIPPPPVSPVQQVKMQGKTRQRARASRTKSDNTSKQPWTWDIASPDKDTP